MLGHASYLLSKVRLGAVTRSDANLWFENSPAPHLICTNQGLVEQANSAARQLLGRDPVGHALGDVLSPNNSKIHNSLVQQCRATREKKPLRLMIETIHSEGHPIFAEVQLAPTDGQRVSVYIKDVTQFRQKLDAKNAEMAATAQQDDLKSRFLASMSHEIRTPFNAVSGLLDILSETPLNAEQTTLIQTGQEATAALLQITNDILDYTKITAGKLALIEEPFNAQDVFGYIYRLFEPTARAKGLKFSVDITTAEDVYLSGDLPRLQQILTNFVSNAIKFTENGEITLWAGTHRRPTGDYELTCVVKDTGIGISMAEQSRLFGEFYRVEDGDTREYDGTGLGLAISKILIRLMDGLIGVKSSVGEGSNFWITLPLKCVAREVVLQPPQKGMETMEYAYNVKGLRILLADDNKTNQMILSRVLSHCGADITTVDNGQEALQVLTASQFDVALMDISMPVMGGVTATRHIRAAPSAFQNMPIIAMTAIASEADQQSYLDAGMTAVMIKPVSKEALLQSIVQAVDRHETLEIEAAETAPTGLFDTTLLQSIFVGLEHHDVRALQQQFTSDLKESVRLLETAIHTENNDEIQRHSHTLKGLAATFGCLSLSKSAELTNYNAIQGSVNLMMRHARHTVELSRTAVEEVDQAFSKISMAA